jgi:arylsulfatase A-like enzyme
MNRPNIIFIFSDQQRYSALGCTGNSVIRTPAFDRLASEGVLFEQAFSSCPICAPYRGQILTGRYSHKNGVPDNEYGLFDEQTTLAQSLKAVGYRTGFIGKWHLGYGPYTPEKRYGFDYMAANNCDHEHDSIHYYENEAGPLPVDTWGPTGLTDLAMQFMETDKQKDDDAPFLLLMSWGPPHWPYDQYPEKHKIYDPEDVDMPPNVPEAMASYARKEIADYYGNISALDEEMGRLMDWLEKEGLRENTILCYASDHGDHLSSHGYGKPSDQWLHHSKRASKATPYEESIHVPFILSYPKSVEAGRTSDVLFNSVDVMPTLLSLAGVEAPDGVQGTDLSHAVLGGEGPEPDSVYLQILGPGWPHRGDWVGFWRGLRTHRWTYARWLSGDVWLFDRENDPFEMENLAGKPEHKEIQAQLEQRLQRWFVDTDDPFETGERDPKTGMLRLGQRFTHEKWKDD